MSKKPAKRFYKTVTVEGQGDRFAVKLDQYTLKTPGKQSLTFARRDHAEHVAMEWDKQVEHIRPELMPCTRLFNVVVERTPETRDSVINEGVKYAGTDLLCYREGGETALSRHQAEHWDPLLEWAEAFGLSLVQTSSIMAITQSDAALDTVRTYLSKLDDLSLTLAVHFISTLGSAVLGLAVIEKHITAKDAFRLSRLDELWQITQWGEVDDAKDRADEIETELVALAGLLD